MTTHWFGKLRGKVRVPTSANEQAAVVQIGEGAANTTPLPEFVEDSVAVVHDAGPNASAQLTQTLSSLDGQRCSIEFHTTETLSRSRELKASREATRVDSEGMTVDRISTVVVPLRTLKVADDVPSRSRSERIANQTTQAGYFNPMADTVASAGEALSEAPSLASTESPKSAAVLAEHRG